jgi:hypothetical protein
MSPVPAGPPNMLDGALTLDAWPRPLEDAPPVASFNLAQTSRGVPYVAGIRVAEEAPRACAICNEIKPADDMARGPDRVSNWCRDCKAEHRPRGGRGYQGEEPPPATLAAVAASTEPSATACGTDKNEGEPR